MRTTPLQQVVISVIFIPFAILSGHMASESNESLDQRQEDLWQVQDEVKELESKARGLDRKIERLQDSKAFNLSQGRALFAEREQMVQNLKYSDYPKSALIGIQIKDDKLAKLAGELDELENAIVDAHARKAREQPSLESRIASLRSEHGLDSPYKDKEINRQEGNREFWGLAFVGSILILCTFVTPLRYCAYVIFGIALLSYITGRRDE
jgi:peptidoglycan hydrolase CwlO-like protein